MPARTLDVAVASRVKPGEASGSSRDLERLVDDLAARGHEVRVAVPDGAGLPTERGTALAAIEARMRRQREWLSHWWGERRPDVIYLEHADDFGHVARQVAHSLGVPVVARFHRLDAFAPEPDRETVLRAMITLHQGCAATVAQTVEHLALLRDRGVVNAELIEGAVDARRFHPRFRSETLRTRWGAAVEDPVALWVGRLLPPKDPSLFAEACEAMRASVPRLRAVVVGDGPERERLRTRLPWATFAGTLGGDDLAAAYASADLLLFASPAIGMEGWGNVVSEAMASGLAVLAYEQGAARACGGSGVSACLVRPNDRVAFIAAAVELASSPERLRATGAAARQAVMPRSRAACAESYEDLLLRVARARP